MKKLFILILIICFGKISFSQSYPVNQSLANTPNTLVTTNSIKATQGLINGSFTDTSAANSLPYLKYYVGAMIWTTVDSSLWVRQKTASTAFWFKIGGAGGGSTGYYWSILGDNVFPAVPANYGVGTADETNLPLKTNGIQRILLPSGGFSLISDTTLNKPMTYNTSTKEWNYGSWFGSSGGGGTNIYNSDGTQDDATRTYNANGQDLIFNNLYNYQVNSNGSGGKSTSITGVEGTNINITTLSATSEGNEIGVQTSYSYLNSYNNAGDSVSFIRNNIGSIRIKAARGNLLIDSLSNFADTTNFKPVVINTTGTGGTVNRVYKATYWPGGGGAGMAIGGDITDAIVGSVLFAGTGGKLQQKDTKFFYDSTNIRLGVGTKTPSYNIHVKDSTSNSTVYIRAEQGNNSYFQMGASWGNSLIQTSDQLYFQVAGSNKFFIGTSVIKLNNDGGNIDIQLAGDNDANTLYVDASADFVGVKTATPATALDVVGVISTDGLNLDRTITAGGTTGNQTINKVAGTVNFATAATTLTVTNSLVTTSSIIFCTVRTDDATATIKNVVAASGSFVITLTAAATAETSVGFMVTN